jgi:hypothetical protein
MFFHYVSYLQRQNFYNNRFSVPPNQLYDPTEKGQFSNIVGKAIADYLSKKINHSLITVNYEAAMKLRNMRLNVRRPDLIAYSQNSMFAIEAKGYSKSSSGNMNKHKDQSRTGGIPVNFSVACVSYNIYNEIKCKYFDPYNEDVPYDLETLSRLSKNYYYGLSGFLDNEFFDYRKIEINGEDFYAVELSYRIFEKLLHDSFLYPRIHFCDVFYYYRPQIILPANIKELAKKGVSNDTRPFTFDSDQSNLYVDNDRIGLIIENR